jgi:hypothetical protein
MLAAAEGRVLEDIEEVRFGEEVYYEAEWQAGPEEFEIRVAPDGTVLDLESEIDD